MASRLATLVAISIVTTIAGVAAGCGAAQRPELSRWDNCFIESARIETSDRYVVAMGENDVVYMHATWGSQPGRTEYTVGTLMIEIPADLSIPTTLNVGVDAVEMEYWEGGQAIVYRSIDGQGTLRINAVNAVEASVTIDVTFMNPTADLLGRGTYRLEDQAMLRVMDSVTDCYSDD